MSSDDELLELVGVVYEAGTDASRWPLALEQLARTLHAPIAGLLYHDVAVNSGHISVIVGADPVGTHLYNTHYHGLDPWVQRAQAAGLIETGAVMFGEQVVPHQELRTTRYYNDFAQKYEGVRLLAGIVLRSGSIFSNISLLRGERQEPFGADEKRFLTALMPHLQRAIAIHRRMDQLRGLSTAAIEAFDRMPFGLVLLDEARRVLFTNVEAGRILREANAVRYYRGRLRATIGAEDAVLQRLLQDATVKPEGKPSVGSVATLSRGCEESPIQVLIAPLKGNAPFAESQRVAVFLSDPDQRSVPQTELLRACFQFTPAETRVVRELLNGRNVKDISAALSLTENTIRSYLKTVLGKTGCRSQSELVALLLRSVAGLRPMSTETG